MTLLDTTVVGVAIPDMVSRLGITYNEMLWVSNAYVLVLAVLRITGGRLGDLLGKRNVYVAGVAVFTVASLLCALSQDAGQLIASRTLQGIGAALLIPQTMSIIIAVFPSQWRGAGHLGRRDRRGHHRGAAAGRPPRQRAGLALDLHHQRADRPARPTPRPDDHPGDAEAAAVRRVRRAGHRAGHARPVVPDLQPAGGAALRLGHRRVVRQRAPAAGARRGAARRPGRAGRGW